LPVAPPEPAPPGGTAGFATSAADGRTLDDRLLGWAVADVAPRRDEGPAGWPARALAWWPTVLVAGVICFATFVAGGGLNLSTTTTVEIVLTLGSALIVAAAALFGPPRERAWGAWPVALLLAFAALTALSVVWSVQPDDSFKDAGRMLSYAAFFGAATMLARAVPAR